MATRSPYLSEPVATSIAFYRHATTPSPNINRRTPSPNDSRSIDIDISDNEQDDMEINNDSSVSDKCELSRERKDLTQIPSGYGLGLGIPTLPDDPDEAYGDPSLVAWRFSDITKPSSLASPTSPQQRAVSISPSPSESIFRDDDYDDDDDDDDDNGAAPPTPSSFSVHTLTPGPEWPPPPSTVVSPINTPRPEDQCASEDNNDDDDDVNTLISDPTSVTETPASPLPPTMEKLLKEISNIPRPEHAHDKRMITSVQAYVVDTGFDRPVSRHSEVRRRKSLRNLRAVMSRPRPPLPSPPATPTFAQERPASPPPPIPVIVQTSTPPQYEYDEMPTPEPANTFEGRGTDRIISDPESVRELLPREFDSEPPMLEPYTPDPNSDLVHEIEALLESSPVKSMGPIFPQKEHEMLAPPSPPAVPNRYDAQTPGAGDAEEFFTPLQTPMERSFHTTYGILDDAILDDNDDHDDDDGASTPTQSKMFSQTADSIGDGASTPTARNISGETTPTVTPGTPKMESSSSSQSTPSRPKIPLRQSSLHSRNESIDSRLLLMPYPPLSITRPEHKRGKSVDSSSLLNRRRPRQERPEERRRSSSASALINRSIRDGPPSIPRRRSSLGKGGLSHDALQVLANRAAAAAEHLQKATSNNNLTSPTATAEIRDSYEIFGGEQQASSGEVVRSGSVKRVNVRTPIRTPTNPGQEFATPMSADIVTSTLIATTPADGIPIIDFGDAPDLQFDTPTVPQRDWADTPPVISRTTTDGENGAPEELPVVFQVIPPTPAANASRQLHEPIPISIPATPEPHEDRQLVLRSDTHPEPNAIVRTTTITSTTTRSTEMIPDDDTLPFSSTNIASNLPFPPPHPAKTPPIPAGRPSTAPERINPDDFGSPPQSPARPSLKKVPAKMRESKLHPWWRPRREPDSPPSSFSTSHTTSTRPETATTITTFVPDETPRAKKRRTLKLGKIEVEFIGIKALREQFKLEKERKKRRRSMSAGNANGIIAARRRSSAGRVENVGVAL